MEPTWLSVITLGPLPSGDLSIALSVRERTHFDAPFASPALTCLFEEPADSTIRLRIGAAQFNVMTEPGFLDEAAVGPGVWPGSLARLSRAGFALKAQDVDALVSSQAGAEGGWFEVEPYRGTWQCVAAERVLASLDDVRLDPRRKPFFVRATGSHEAVRSLLRSLRDGTQDPAGDA